MKKGLIRKGLVFSVIVLFIGVGIQPALSVESNESEDCIGCQLSDGYSRLRVNLLLTRLKIIINLIFTKYGNILEDKEKGNILLDNIKIIRLNYYDIICPFLENISNFIFSLLLYMNASVLKYKDNPIILAIYRNIGFIIMMYYVKLLLFLHFYCGEPLPY